MPAIAVAYGDTNPRHDRRFLRLNIGQTQFYGEIDLIEYKGHEVVVHVKWLVQISLVGNLPIGQWTAAPLCAFVIPLHGTDVRGFVDATPQAINPAEIEGLAFDEKTGWQTAPIMESG